MNLKIEKLPTGEVRITLATSTKSKPLTQDLASNQIEAVARMLATAARPTSSALRWSLIRKRGSDV